MKNLALLLLRVSFGSLIMVHGFPKLFGGPTKKATPTTERYLGTSFTQSLQHGGLENFAKAVERIGAPAPPALAALSAGTEFFGGLALVLGWHTRLATLLLMGNMSTAIGKVHWSKGLLNPDGFEKALLFLCGFATIFIAGPGKLSLDHN